MTAGLESKGETTRRRILEVLRRRGPCTLQELADAIGITRMGRVPAPQGARVG